MFNVLFGNFRIQRKTDYFVLPLKILYIVYNIPFLLFAFLLFLRSFGAFGNGKNEKFGIVKKVLLHFTAIVSSFFFWIIILSVLEDKLNFKIRLHLF
jgi:hypothetical protein